MAYYDEEYYGDIYGGQDYGEEQGQSQGYDQSQYYSSYSSGDQGQEFDWEGYFQLLEENAQSQGSGGFTYYGTAAAPTEERMTPSYSAFQNTGYGTGYHGGGGSYHGPTGKLDLSGIDLDLPEYKLPEEDESIYKKEYEQVYQRTKAPVEQGVHEAIMSSKSLDNPMARMDFVRKALSGYGEALTGISQAATKAAQEKAAFEYNKMVQEYNMQYKAQYAEAVAAYEKEIQAAISNWEHGTSGESADMWDEWNKKLIEYYG